MSKNLPKLNKEYLKDNLLGTELADYSADILEYPERVIQFGEGNFLRAFVDWMFHQMNKEDVFKGRAVIVQPIPQGRVSNLNKQDGLYTLFLRGKQDGKVVDQREVMTAVSRGLEAYTQWDEVLKLAENPKIEFIVSNTTEAGIVYSPDDKLNDTPPDSYPGKLTAYLYHRYQFFNGDSDKGMLIIPVELIERNGDILREVVLKLADNWKLPEGFKDWIREHNTFVNTLVDRIVTGYPFKEKDKLEEELGYCDENLDTGEIFHLWIIEGDEALKEKLPFHKAGLNVKWVDDVTPYRSRKVKILNGAHTSTVPVSYLAGIDLVRDAVDDQLLSNFIKSVIFENIIPTMSLSAEELEDFAKKILERFANPFIDHKWLDISLNSTSKFKTRVLPSLVEFIEQKEELPDKLIFSLAALITFYKGTEIRDKHLVAYRQQEEYLIKDDISALEFFADLWSRYENNELGIEKLAEDVLGHQEFWQQDLNKLPGLTAAITDYLKQIEEQGVKKSLTALLDK
ncbi:tagaturonate reductase [Halocella sp. SP3-1]|uniref:tagaturonate reductase n=1 Tax=Halocella sp. SP3-1 TaxID=2382161 RepID=UPI000F75EBFF|nr:tagaturonate reductase [Halocella sp. SP3-1]AZO94379.1 tagaturonate reductase [Halocella sp. SP3-1]